MSQHEPERRELRVMMDYYVQMPLFDEEGEGADEGLGLSEELLADLRAFAARWDEFVAYDEVFDDRFEGTPFVPTLIECKRSVSLWFAPSRRRAIKREDQQIRALGEDLRRRVQQEVGDGYVVTYRH